MRPLLSRWPEPTGRRLCCCASALISLLRRCTLLAAAAFPGRGRVGCGFLRLLARLALACEVCARFILCKRTLGVRGLRPPPRGNGNASFVKAWPPTRLRSKKRKKKQTEKACFFSARLSLGSVAVLSDGSWLSKLRGRTCSTQPMLFSKGGCCRRIRPRRVFLPRVTGAWMFLVLRGS